MTARNYEQELDLVKADLSGLRDDIKTLVVSLGQDARDRISTAADAAKKYGKKGADAAEHQITQHPFTSVAVTFGVGLLLGRLLHGK